MKGQMLNAISYRTPVSIKAVAVAFVLYVQLSKRNGREGSGMLYGMAVRLWQDVVYTGRPYHNNGPSLTREIT